MCALAELCQGPSSARAHKAHTILPPPHRQLPAGTTDPAELGGTHAFWRLADADAARPPAGASDFFARGATMKLNVNVLAYGPWCLRLALR